MTTINGYPIEILDRPGAKEWDEILSTLGIQFVVSNEKNIFVIIEGCLNQTSLGFQHLVTDCTPTSMSKMQRDEIKRLLISQIKHQIKFKQAVNRHETVFVLRAHPYNLVQYLKGEVLNDND